MKKVLITTILTFIILASFLSTNVFAVTVTEDSLQNSINKIISSNSAIVKMDRVNDTITAVGNNIVIKYNIDNNPKFTMDFEFNNQMTKEQCLNEHKFIVMLIQMFQLIADHFGCTKDGALSYFVDKVENGDSNVRKVMNFNAPEYTNPVSYAKLVFNNDVNFSDSLFTIKSKMVSETTEDYKAQVILEVNLNGDFTKVSEFDSAISDTILDAAQNAADKYGEASKNEEAELAKYEASLNAKILVEDLKEKLDVYRDSVQIDNKLYLKYSADEVYDIYMNMTSNSVKIFEKNTNYFKKSGYYYYDTGRLRTLPIINYTDVLQSFLEVKSASESEATFDIIIKNIVSGDAVETYKNGLKIVKKDGEWLIDSLKFKPTVEEFDYYPEFVEIEKEEPSKTDDKKEETKKEENKTEESKNEDIKVESNEKQNTDKVENINTENNTSNISNQTTNVTTTESTDTYIIILKYALYVAIGLLAVGLIYFVYKIIKYRKDDDNKSL